MSVSLILLKYQSYENLSWPLTFQLRMTLPFIAQMMGLSAPFALALSAIKWQEKMHDMKCFEAAASLGYSKKRFACLKTVFVLTMVFVVLGLMNVIHPQLNRHQGKMIQEAAQYFHLFQSDQFVKQPAQGEGNMVLYHHQEEGKFNDYFIQFQHGDKLTYYWVDHLVSRNDDANWLLSFGEGRQLLTQQDHSILQWSQFGGYQLALPLVTQKLDQVSGYSTFGLSDEVGVERQEKFLRLSLGVFMGLVGYLMFKWPNQTNRQSYRGGLKKLVQLLLMTLALIGLMALVKQGILLVQSALMLQLTLVLLRGLDVKSA